MKAAQTKHTGLYPVLGSLTIALVLSILIACNEPGPRAQGNLAAPVSQADALATPTFPFSRLGLDPRYPTQRAELYELATHDAEVATHAAPTAAIFDMTDTAIARTPEALRPTATPMPVMPTPTLLLGFGQLLQQPGAGQPLLYDMTYWQGMVNGQLESVSLVHLRTGYLDDLRDAQFLLIYHGKFLECRPCEAYKLPDGLRPAMIARVEAGQVTIAERDLITTTNPYQEVPKPGGKQVVFNLMNPAASGWQQMKSYIFGTR